MRLKENMDALEKIADENEECYCPDGVNDLRRCRGCFASVVLNEIAEVAYDGVMELSKTRSDYWKGKGNE